MNNYLFIDEGNIINIIIEYVKCVNIFIKGNIVTTKRERKY
jgi:hypothetical protein